jgi:manganese-dependent ADP-ribose/CDP-alcohol diphosphatase
MLRFIHHIALIVCLTLCTLTPLSAQTPAFSFGVVADIQYGDRPPINNRNFAASINNLAACVADWNTQPLAFTIQLGDIIQGNATPVKTMQDLRTILRSFDHLRHPLYHVIGNHCCNIKRTELEKELSLDRAYYSFVYEEWRFIILDCMDISLKGRTPGHELYSKAQAYLAANPDFKESGGAIGDVQKKWLAAQLEIAGRQKERVMIFSHRSLFHPEKPESEFIWNAAEIRSLIDANECVAVVFNGHHHYGGYGLLNGIHYVTLESMVDAPEIANGYGVVDVYADRIELVGTGTVTSRVLMFDGE